MAIIDDTRRRLVEAAGELFARLGFDATNVRDITRAAGTNLAAVNYHFGSKEELYVEAVKHAASSCDHESPMPIWEPGVPAEVRLREFIRAFLARMLRRDMPEWHRLLIFREVAEPRHGACEVFVQNFVRPTFEIVLKIIKDLVPPDVPLREINLIGGSVVGQCLHYHHARHIIPLLIGPSESSGYELELLTDHIWRFSLTAIRGMYVGDDPAQGRDRG